MIKTVDELYRAIIETNIQHAEHLVREITTDMNHEQVLEEVLSPLLDRIGGIEQTEWLNLAQGYVTAKLVKRILLEYREAIEAAGITPPPPTKKVVLCNAEDDCHPIGREIVSTILHGHGWGVRDLGIDVEASVLLDAAQKINANVLGVSAMTYTTASNVRKVRDEISKRGLTGKVKLAVGGVAFRLAPELVEEVGADGTSPTALQAPALFERLWKEAYTEMEVTHAG